MSGRKIIEGLEEAVAMARAPTDAEVEAMAERLWDVWRVMDGGRMWAYAGWADIVMQDATLTPWRMHAGSAVQIFRAMARVALEARDDR